MQNFTYNAEEIAHLRDFSEAVSFEVFDDRYGPEYWRHEAKMMREHPKHYDWYNCSAEDMEEQADGIEAGRYRDDWL